MKLRRFLVLLLSLALVFTLVGCGGAGSGKGPDESSAPAESISAWIVYEKQVDKNEVTIHHYSSFGNQVPDLMFRFTVSKPIERSLA
ncbi:MAG: hypothetical protein ACOX2X_01935 [Peptococcia bacterium]